MALLASTCQGALQGWLGQRSPAPLSARLALDPARPGDRPGERVFGRLVTAVQACIDAGAARQGNANVMAVNIWVALHGIVSLRTSRPDHPWPPAGTLIDAALSGQAGLDG